VDQLGAEGAGAGAGVEGAGEGAGRAGEVVRDRGAGQPGGVAVKRPDGRWARAESLRSAMTCSMIAWSGPYGTFTSSVSHGHGPVVLIAGGIGITPFIELAHNGPADRIWLFHQARTSSELIFRRQLTDLLGSRYVPAVADRADRLGLPQQLYAQDIVHRVGPRDAARARFLVCGSPTFVERVSAGLRSQMVPARNIITEQFEL
jgi:ferredoxin-NADP reductase